MATRNRAASDTRRRSMIATAPRVSQP
jgi:hypothetical protein